ncbi:MAG TPA: type I asparaginase [Bacteroidales bacterium]|nr:type I asparaginase [Bacteroidales bacterium]HPS17460.1 type I asparaginase [Bacteroidales bacterium]
MKNKTSILIIYTGGTIGMIEDEKSGALKPFDFKHLLKHLPELKKFNLNIDSYSFNPLIDSSNMNPAMWVELAKVIQNNYEKFDGFVILHGSDTMAFTASALSFMLENLSKPVILTGSQLPIGVIRTDGRENLITAIEIAATRKNDKPLIPEVCIYFEHNLYRGNRTHKFNAENFSAFTSANYPPLAEVGVRIKFNNQFISNPIMDFLIVHTKLDANIAILKLFPGIEKNTIEAFSQIKGLKALILETYGSGNAPTDKWFLEALEKMIKKGIIILNVTQCKGGAVAQGKYETGASLYNIGVIGGADITTEAAVTKLMYLLGENFAIPEIKKLLKISLRGELTED